MSYLGKEIVWEGKCPRGDVQHSSSEVRLSLSQTSNALETGPGRAGPGRHAASRRPRNSLRPKPLVYVARQSLDWLQWRSSVRGRGKDCVRVRRRWNAAGCLRWSEVAEQRTMPPGFISAIIRSRSMHCEPCVAYNRHHYIFFIFNHHVNDSCYYINYILLQETAITD